MKPSKAVFILFPFTLLLCGCFSQSSLTKGETVPVDEAVVFYLKDGSYVMSDANQHRRVETGYQVSGDRYMKIGEDLRGVHWKKEPFSGAIADSDIQEITAKRFNVVTTVLVSAAGVGIVAGVIWVADDPKHRPF